MPDSPNPASPGGPIPAAALLALLAVQIMFGIHYIAAKRVMETIPPPAWATIRVCCAASLLVALDLLRNGKPSIPIADFLKMGAFSFFGVALNQVTFTEGLARTTPAHSALIVTLIPVSAFLFALILGREKTTRRKTAGIATAFAGVLILLQVESFSIENRWVVGDILTLVNSCSFGFFLVISRRLARRYSPLTMTAWTMAWGALCIAAYGWRHVLAVEPSAIGAGLLGIAIWIVLFPTVLAYLLNFFALRRVESSTVALFIYLQPLIATLLSVGLGKESLNARFLVSAALVFAGVYLVAARRRPARWKSSSPDANAS